MSERGLQVVVVTGMSGAGRSTALRVLEDAGFYCVDNLPPTLASNLLALVHQEGEIRFVGLGIDVRSGAFLVGLDAMLAEVQQAGHRVEMIFVDCSDDVLVRRFSETRRPHALAPTGDLLDAIGREREHLAAMRLRADVIIDTTEFTIHDLRRHLMEFVGRTSERCHMIVRLVSFGFKYGLPVHADLVFDLRFLPNPYFVESLRPQNGCDDAVADYVLQSTDTQEFLKHIRSLLDYLIPQYAREAKAYLTVALGCTGGRHRSVALVEELAEPLRTSYEVSVMHRDVGRMNR